MKHKVGTKAKPLVLQTPPHSSEFTMHVDTIGGKELLVCTVGKTVLLLEALGLAEVTHESRGNKMRAR